MPFGPADFLRLSLLSSLITWLDGMYGPMGVEVGGGVTALIGVKTSVDGRVAGSGFIGIRDHLRGVGGRR